MNKILFSGIGDTDPFRNDYDGSMLHIVRHCHPSKVFLYFTKEMYDQKNKLKSCITSIKAISKDIEVIVLPKEEDLINDAHRSDVFIEPFKNIINKIIIDNKGCEIILNISSGTPAMKNTMLILYLFDSIVISNKLLLKAVQVVSPNPRSNQKISYGCIENLKSEDIFHIVNEELFDVMAEAPNRLLFDSFEKLKTNFLANKIITMINNYQYGGAYLLMEESKHLFSPEVILLITHLKNRSAFNVKEADKNLRELKLTEFIISDPSLKKVIEYLNIIKINEKKNIFHGTYIMIVALIDLIFEKTAEKKGVNFKSILTENKIDLKKIKENYPNYIDIFDNQPPDKYLKTEHILKILERKDIHQYQKKLIETYRNIKNSRNHFAHEVDIFAYDKIKNININKVINIVNENIKLLYGDVYKSEYENIYDNLNSILRSKL